MTEQPGPYGRQAKPATAQLLPMLFPTISEGYPLRLYLELFGLCA